MSFYILITVSYSLIAGASFRSTFNLIDKIAPYICNGQDIQTALQKAQLTIKDDSRATSLRSTATMLCPYYKNNSL